MNKIRKIFSPALILFCLYYTGSGQEIEKTKANASCGELYHDRPQVSLYLAISDQNRECVKEFLQKGASPNYILDANLATAPLSVALAKPDIEIISALLKAGASVKGEQGYFALIIASANGYLDVIKLLIDAGADINTKSKFRPRFTTLSAAVHYDKEDIVVFLLEAGAEVDGAFEAGENSLMLAANNPNIINALLKAGAKTDLKDKQGRTALFYAINDGQPEKVEILLRNGANSNLKDKNGLTLLELTGQIENVKLKERIISILRENGAK